MPEQPSASRGRKKNLRNVRETIGLCLGWTAALILPLLLLPAMGCASDPSGGSPSLAEDGQALFGGSGSTAREAGKWTIVLAAFRGDEAAEAAQFALSRVVGEGGLSDARIEQRGQAYLLTLGRFDGPEDPRAAAELERVRNTTIQGVEPFQQALLTPPEPPRGGTPQYDLRNVDQFFGPGYAYTLQIGTYGRSDGQPPSEADRADAREAAEQAVAVLRAEGEQAFYYHGPNFSNVTVGLFRESDVDPQTGMRSAPFYDLQAKFPYNLLNGAQRTVRIEGGARQAQRSVLVRIP